MPDVTVWASGQPPPQDRGSGFAGVTAGLRLVIEIGDQHGDPARYAAERVPTYWRVDG
jgi:hypothetical protein